MTTRPTTQQPAARARPYLGVAMMAGLLLAVIAIVDSALRVPAHIDELTVDNPHPWMASIDVTDADRDGWVGVGTVEREQRQTFRSILDQGPRWTIRFTYAGIDVEETLTSFELGRRGWRVTVPDELADRLRAAAVPETPPHHLPQATGT
jgi:hypothetical protein